MPRSKTGIKRPPVNIENLRQAILAVSRNTEEKMSLREAAKVYKVSIATLSRHLQAHRNTDGQDFTYKSNLDVKKVFSLDEERSLVNYITNVAKMHYGLTKKGVRELAFKFAEANKKKMPSNWEQQKLAGEEWMRHFMKRHENKLSIRKPEATSLARATSFNRSNVDKFFFNIEQVHRRFNNNIPPARIWNLDETGCTTVQAPPKIVAPKGIKQIGSMTSAERGQLITVICAISATGNHIPPFLIFPRVNFKDYMIHGAPPGTVGSANPSGWSNDEQFLKFMEHFIKHVKPSTDEPVLLIMDNHETHCSFDAIDLASKSGIKIVTFPPHTSHRLQPLDISVFGPFKTFYNQGLDAWHINNPGKTFSIYNVAEIIGTAFPRAFSTANICSGFKNTGIYPLDKGIFGEDQFLPSLVTDRPIPSTEDKAIPGPSSKPDEFRTEPIAGTSSTIDESKIPKQSDNAVPFISPEEIRPFPKVKTQKKRKRASGATKILTDTPEREQLLSKKQAKQEREEKKNRKLFEVKRKQVTKTLFRRSSSSSSNDEEVFYEEESDVEGKTLFDILSGSSDNEDTNDIDLQPPTSDEVAIGDFVLVSFKGKTEVVYYVGCVQNCLSENEFSVSFLRKTSNQRFHYPSVADVATVDIGDIVVKLSCINTVGTARTQNLKSFNFPFHKFNTK